MKQLALFSNKLSVCISHTLRHSCYRRAFPSKAGIWHHGDG